MHLQKQVRMFCTLKYKLKLHININIDEINVLLYITTIII